MTELDADFMERLIESVAAELEVPVDELTNAVTDFVESETETLALRNQLLALGVNKRAGGPNDGAEE